MSTPSGPSLENLTLSDADLATGRFVCFACGAWGYLAEARQRWQDEQQRQAALRRPPARLQRAPRRRPVAAPRASQQPAYRRRVSLSQGVQIWRSSWA